MESHNLKLINSISEQAVSFIPRYAKNCMIRSKKNLMTTLIREAYEQIAPKKVDMNRQIKSIRELIRENNSYRQKYENLRKKIFSPKELYNSEEVHMFNLMSISGPVFIIITGIIPNYCGFVVLLQLLISVILSIKFHNA